MKLINILQLVNKNIKLNPLNTPCNAVNPQYLIL